MCGISIILGTPTTANFASRLLAMHAVIPHRGPDGEGFLVVDWNGLVFRPETSGHLRSANAPRAGFAFRRLKICDLSESAAQPMGSADRRTWLVFNGEAYNFRELRTELVARGRVFRTKGDTEVVLAAYEEWGVGCFERLEGMWAIAIIDLRRNRLVVSRDRFGIKPLFWTVDANGSMLFASEIKQLLAAQEGGSPRSNRPLIEMYLRGQRYPALEETFFEGICAVPPATWAEIDLAMPAAPSFHAYWQLSDFTAQHNELPYEEAVDRAEQYLARAVASHRMADVNVGALLSGGIDSSTLVALSNQMEAPRLATFSLGYRAKAPQFCEMRYVDAMTRRHGLENHETTLDASWIAANADRALWALEEPPLAMPAFAQFRLFEFCAQHGATVILDGQGADEITGGYPYHQRAFLKDRLLRMQPLAMLTELRAIARHEARFSAAMFADFFVWPHLRRRQHHEWIAPGGSRAAPLAFEVAQGDRGFDVSQVNRQLYFDVRWGNVKIVLGYGDRSAMAHSIEARVPYFDRAFVELLFSLPDTYKIGGGERKHLLRDIARRHVPREITERADRMGYGTPDEAMLRGPLRDEVASAVNEPGFRAAGWIVPTKASRFLADFQRGVHNDYRAVWRLFALSRWANRFHLRS